MKFGIFYEAQLPRPWTPESEHRLFQDMLAQIELADRLGSDYPRGGVQGGRWCRPPRPAAAPPHHKPPPPPLWVACSNILTIASAGRWGLGALGFQFVSPEAARAWVNRYYIELTKHPDKLGDYPANPNIAMVSGFMCADTDERAREKAAGWTFFVFCLSHYGRHGIPHPGRGNMWEGYQEWRTTPKDQVILTIGLIGSA